MLKQVSDLPAVLGFGKREKAGAYQGNGRPLTRPLESVLSVVKWLENHNA
jgi:hypothetical protein